MPVSALALVLSAALFHAAWNALTKRGRDPLAFLWSANTLGGVLLLPWAARELALTGVPAAAWPFVSATIALHAIYFYFLGRAYRSGDYSLVYPIARGVSVGLVPILAFFLLGERLSPLGSVGVALVVLGLVALQLAGRGAGSSEGAGWPLRAGTGWALLTGLTIAGYSLVDKAGVARLHPVPYLAFIGFGQTLFLLPPLLRRPGVLRREWAANWRSLLVASVLTLGGYLLVLFAFRLSKAGYVVAAREVSIVFSAIIGSVWLGEGRLGPRLLGAGVMLAGVTCVAFAR